MQQPRKSRPHLVNAPQLRVMPASDVEATLVTPPPISPGPTGPRRQMSGPDIIPFAKPRAMAAMPAEFAPAAPAGFGPRASGVGQKPSLPSPVARNAAPFAPIYGNAAPAYAPVPAAVPAAGSSPVAAPVPVPVPAPAPVPVPAHGYPVYAPPLADARSPKPEAPSASPWARFEKLGLLAPKLDPKKLSKHIVTAYRLLGFAILTIIVVVLIGYIAQTTFFYLSDSWICPMAIAPTDEKVVSLQAELAERENARDRTAGDLADAERAIAVQQQFQAEFQKAIQSDLDGRKAALEKMHELAAAAASTRASIRHTNSSYAAASQRRMQQEYAAGLIDRQAMLAGKYELAQISSSNLSLAERQADFETRAADLEAQTRSLEALLANTTSDEPMSYDVLKIKQEYEQSRLETQKALELRDTLKASLARETKLVDSIQHSAYLRAIADHAQVAFVPYGNLHTISAGTSLYRCRLGMIICHEVGTVLEILPGEVSFKHPHRDKMLRGQMVELKLEDGADATDDVLFVGGRPLFI